MNLYLLFKSLHLIAVISWFAGLLYLPRIFVYHADASHETQKEVFKTMERKLYNYIMMPAMLLSWLFGVLLIHSLGLSVFKEIWMQIKIILVVILTFYHFTLSKYLMDFASDTNQKSSKFFRIYNEIPTIILIVVIFVVVFKPL
ncbi:MAG: protoporphyrinogen oxidase HemJ [Pseudomonadota bacterium]|nr:protoporphyrinogen oxidase HemJ [Pseudomonadota bacterium]